MKEITSITSIPPVPQVLHTFPGAKDFSFDESTHTYKVNDVTYPSPSSLFKEFGLVDGRYFTDWHRDKGHAVHATTHYHDDGDLNIHSVSQELKPYLDSWILFREEWHYTPIKELREKWMISFVNKFGVTPDSVGTTPKGLTIVEIKSGQVNKLTCALQTAAQSIAISENYNLFPVIRLIVQLTPDGYKVFEFKDHRQDRAEFLGMVQTHWVKRRT